MAVLRDIFARFTTQFDDRALRRGESTTERLTESLQRVGGILAGGFAAFAGYRFIDDAIALGDSIAKTSQQIGVSTDDFQRWRFAARQSGVSTEQLRVGMIQLARNISLASQGSGESIRSFRRLGVSLRDQNGELITADTAMLSLATRLEGVQNQTERTAILTTVLGESGSQLAPLFNQGAAGVRALLAELDTLGGPISAEGLAQTEALADAQGRLTTMWENARTKVVLFLAPAIEFLLGAFTKLFVAFQRIIVDSGLLLPILGGLATAFLVIKAAAIKTWIGILGPIALAAIAVVAFGLILQDLWVAIKGGTSLMGQLTDALNLWFEANRENTGWEGSLIRGWENTIKIFERAYQWLEALLDLYRSVTGTTSERALALVNIRRAAEGRTRIEDLGGAGDTMGRTRRRGLGPPPVVVNQSGEIVPPTDAPVFEITRPAAAVEAVQPAAALTVAAPTINQTTTINVTGSDENLLRQIRTELDRRDASLSEDLRAFGGVGEE